MSLDELIISKWWVNNLVLGGVGGIIGVICGYLSQNNEDRVSKSSEKAKLGAAVLFGEGMNIVEGSVYYSSIYGLDFNRLFNNDPGVIFGLYSGFKLGQFISRGLMRLNKKQN